MARAIITPKSGRRPAHEPIYDIDAHTGASIEVFYAGRVLAGSFGTREEGWRWWSCQPGRLPDQPPSGPFRSSYLAYRDALGGATRVFGRCANLSSAAQDLKS
jgi:hypothetical protein